MKAEKLMIGDLVKLKDAKLGNRNFVGPIVKIKSITGNHVLVPNGKGLLEDVTDEYLLPIPLTPEILERNGFRVIFDGELHVSYFQDIESFHTEVKVDKIGIYQILSMLDGLGNGITIVECKYVHQLQHALRNFGIEKEIVA